MTENVITTAYNLLEPTEREAVDEYVIYVLQEQNRKHERIIHALNQPINNEHVRRSRGILHRPLVKAALAEKIKEAANEQDISPDKVIQEYANIGFSSLSDYIEEAGFGDYRIKPLNQIAPEKWKAVKTIESKPGMYGLSTRITLHDKLPALKALTDLMGLTSPDRPPVLTEYVRPVEIERQDYQSEELYTKLLEGEICVI